MSESISAGFYKHYNHDPSIDRYNNIHQVLHIAHHTEMKDEKEARLVIYRSLYPKSNGKMYIACPISKFIELVDHGGLIVYRFTRVTDPEEIKILEDKVKSMYINC